MIPFLKLVHLLWAAQGLLLLVGYVQRHVVGIVVRNISKKQTNGDMMRVFPEGKSASKQHARDLSSCIPVAVDRTVILDRRYFGNTD